MRGFLRWRVGASMAVVAGAILLLLKMCSGPAVGVDSLTVGTGYDSATRTVTGQATDFAADQEIYIVFTTHSPERAVAQVFLLRSGNLEDRSLPVAVAKGDHVYVQPIMLGQPGTVTINVSYNGMIKETMQFKVG
jgi:hypothetical protein